MQSNERQNDDLKNQFRMIPLIETFMKNKRIYDIIYGYLQIHSYIDKNKNRFVYVGVIDNKSLLYSEILHYTGKSDIFCYNSFLSSLKLLFDIGLIEKGITTAKDGISEIECYFLKQVIPNKLIKLDTLEYLISTANKNVIKIYAYLLNCYSYKQSDLGDKQPYEFTKKELSNVIGYTSKSFYKNIGMILESLQSCGLIKYHISMKKNPAPNTPFTFYYYLDSVSLDRNNKFDDDWYSKSGRVSRI